MRKAPIFCALFAWQKGGKDNYAERLAALHSEIPVIPDLRLQSQKSEIGDHKHEKMAGKPQLQTNQK